MQENYIVGIYARLSRDDERAGESVSIENQKEMLSRYVREQGWTLRRSGAILMRSFTIWHQKIVSCWQNAIAFRRRLMSGIAAIRGR